MSAADKVKVLQQQREAEQRAAEEARKQETATREAARIAAEQAEVARRREEESARIRKQNEYTAAVEQLLRSSRVLSELLAIKDEYLPEKRGWFGRIITGSEIRRQENWVALLWGRIGKEIVFSDYYQQLYFGETHLTKGHYILVLVHPEKRAITIQGRSARIINEEEWSNNHGLIEDAVARSYLEPAEADNSIAVWAKQHENEERPDQSADGVTARSPN